MVAESAKAAFDSPDWIFEIKLDGYRAITVFDSAGEAHLWSRNGLPLEAKFPALANAVSKLKLRSTILDGEVVALDENGIPRFQLLQRFQKQPKAPTLYYVFDVLWYKGDDLTGKSILERRSVLERILKPTAEIQLGNYVEDEGKALFELTKERGMEGIIAKRKDSIYRPGKRSSDWLKIKTRLQQEFVVGGFTAPKGSRKHLGAIVLGAYTKGRTTDELDQIFAVPVICLLTFRHFDQIGHHLLSRFVKRNLGRRVLPGLSTNLRTLRRTRKSKDRVHRSYLSRSRCFKNLQLIRRTGEIS